MLGNEIVDTFLIKGKKFDVYGCYDSDTPEGEYDFYDVYISGTGDCINEGDPFYEQPTQEDVEATYKEWLER